MCLFFATGTCFAGTPDWVSVPAKKFPPAKYFTSVGTGYNRDVAELQAVKGIASIFGQNIVSTTSSENRMQQARINGDVATANVSSIEQNVLRQVNQDDVMGGEIKEYTDMLNEARQIAVKRMVDEATALGADAVLNVRYGTSSMMQGAAEVVAYGTAVKIK